MGYGALSSMEKVRVLATGYMPMLLVDGKLVDERKQTTREGNRKAYLIMQFKLVQLNYAYRCAKSNFSHAGFTKLPER